MAKVGLISLGCPKNQVNGERMLHDLQQAGFTVADVYDGVPDAVIVNTCGFVDDAKREAIDAILEMTEKKARGEIRAVLVTGCLAQRYREEVAQEIPEVDAVLGLGANGSIAAHVTAALRGEGGTVCPPVCELPLTGGRTLSTPRHTAYLQIAEGCNHRCAFCAIPEIRGPYRSRPLWEIIEEAEDLVRGGVRELVLIAQDTTRYGRDFGDGTTLTALLADLAKIADLRWMRLLYAYPDAVTDELIDFMAQEPKMLRYIDLPLQHADDRILKRMRRPGTKADAETLVGKFRAAMPDICIRTTFITGLPGEDEAAFTRLCEFVQNMNFDRVGVFAFSPQEGTDAFAMEDRADPETAAHRAEILMQQHNHQLETRDEKLIGRVLEVVTEDFDGYTDCYIGRSYRDAPEIDCQVYFTSNMAPADGTFVRVRILGLRDGDLLGRAVDA